MNSVNLIGRLTTAPELRYTNNGTAVASLRVAVDGAGQWNADEEKYDAGFFNVTVWGKQAEVTAEHCDKGRQVGIEGRLTFRTYEREDESTAYVTEVTAERIHFLSRPQEAEAEQPAKQGKPNGSNKPSGKPNGSNKPNGRR